jgi:glycosyltransferase involved in cell wall biosynthesis
VKILLIHNHYSHAGGEDEVFHRERALLRSTGHHVIEYTRHSAEVVEGGIWANAATALQTINAVESVEDLRSLLQKEKPDVAHFHNTFPLISPGAYYPCREAGIPVIQTLQNYRLICPAATLRRNGAICEECLDGSLLRGVLHGCYRGSRPASAAVALMLAIHRRMNTWTKLVDRYVSPSEFVRRKFVQSGMPRERISVKPNFVYPDPGARTGKGEYALYIGRCSPEKGVGTLLQAWTLVGKDIPLRIVGDGPVKKALQAQGEKAHLANVRFEGWIPQEEVRAILEHAAFLIFPSEWYEPFGLGIAEAFARGVPVIASPLGAVMEIVESGKTGLHFIPGDPKDLAAKVEWAWTHPTEMKAMGVAARAEYQAKYTAKRNYDLMMEIYRRAQNTTIWKAA